MRAYYTMEAFRDIAKAESLSKYKERYRLLLYDFSPFLRSFGGFIRGFFPRYRETGKAPLSPIIIRPRRTSSLLRLVLSLSYKIEPRSDYNGDFIPKPKYKKKKIPKKTTTKSQKLTCRFLKGFAGFIFLSEPSDCFFINI